MPFWFRKSGWDRKVKLEVKLQNLHSGSRQSCGKKLSRYVWVSLTLGDRILSSQIVPHINYKLQREVPHAEGTDTTELQLRDV